MATPVAKNLDWQTKLSDLCSKSQSSVVEKLATAGIHTIEDLLWIFPLSIDKAPTLSSFAQAREGELFKGRGEILSCQIKPNFFAKGKRGTLLYNVTLHVRDSLSSQILTMRWFNAYPSIKKKLEGIKKCEFQGSVSLFQGQLQIVNPEINSRESEETILDDEVVANDMLIRYPTVNSVPGVQIKKLIELLPDSWWNTCDQLIPHFFQLTQNSYSLGQAFRQMHGKGDWKKELSKKAIERLVYHEFLLEQLKVILRRQIGKAPQAEVMQFSVKQLEDCKSLFSFKLTADQENVINQIVSDFSSGTPMMRLVQGDVGCGKTAVAIIASMLAIEKGGQVALMCPTESLALQHYLEINEVMTAKGKNPALLLGSTPRKEKMDIQTKLIAGEIDIVVGTHSLIQETVQFKNLVLAIIDEQHKFGVRQRIKLTEKGMATHSLIMTATPIPRSLSLTQFGDLDISVIKTMPAGRKGQKTRIVTPQTFEQFLSFVQTRLEMGEQGYIVVPAIEENEKQEMLALETVYQKLISFFPNASIGTMHGRMKSEEKEQALYRFRDGKDQLLLATSVIEVGINNPQATIMAIMNPERFGLSSLHQLRGRVGRGDKVGFCFLVNDRQISADSLHRLMIIEKYTDGFIIAEEDLKIRGEGDLFGTGQSGGTSRKIANIIEHAPILHQVREDLHKHLAQDSSELKQILSNMMNDPLILSTI